MALSRHNQPQALRLFPVTLAVLRNEQITNRNVKASLIESCFSFADVEKAIRYGQLRRYSGSYIPTPAVYREISL